MPRIDPQRLLKCLNPLLDGSGAIKSDKEVDKIYGLMSKFSKKLVSKCMYLNILKATPDEVLDLFMQRGGWEMLYTWTSEANSNKNYPLLTEISYLLLKTPATTSRLKENELPKIIKTLSRESEKEDTKNVARQVFSKWMAIAKREESGSSLQNSRILKPLDTLENSSTTYDVAPIIINDNPSLGDDNVIIMETDCPPNEFDVNQFIANADLTSLDFNPDIFNNTVDQHLDDVHLNYSPIRNDQAHSSTRIFAADSTSSLDTNTVDSKIVQQPQQIFIKSSTDEQSSATSNAKPKVAPYALVIRDGKHYLMKIHQVENTPQLVEEGNLEDGQTEPTVEDIPKKRARKDSTIKFPTPIVSGGKPCMKTYGLKVKTAEAVALEQALLSEKVTKKGTPSVLANKKGKPTLNSSAEAKKVTAKSATKSKASSKSLAEAAKQEADDEKFRKKMAEQKKLLDLRKKEAEREKLQKEKDEATLKTLKLSTTSNAKIPKIPKRNVASFTDMIGIPGGKDESVERTESKKVKKRNYLDGAIITSPTVTTPTEKSNKSVAKTTDEIVPIKERKHRPKVYNNAKSRSLCLLADMELTIKENEKSAANSDNKVTEDVEKVYSEKEKQPARISSKISKRPSIDSLTKPGDTKKSKTSVEKEKDKLQKDSKRKVRDEKEVKAKDKEKDSLNRGTKKVVGIQESSLFMDAITASASLTSKKRKRRTSSSGENGKDLDQISQAAGKDKIGKGKQSTSPTEETVPAKPIFNFYRDTLGESIEDSTQGINPDEKQSDEDKNAFEPEEGEGMLKSSLILHRSKNKIRKTVRWKEEENLKEFHFFDLDETERVNVVRQLKNFTEMKNDERSQERKIIRRNLFGVVDIMEEKAPWRKPIPFVLQKGKNLPVIPVKSLEKSVQEEREKGILEVFYFSRNQIPDSADETLIIPNYDLTPPKNIQFDDPNEVTQVVKSDLPPSDDNKSGNMDASVIAGLARPGPNGLDGILNGLGFNIPPPGYITKVQEPFNNWSNNPFVVPPTDQDIWNLNGPQGEIPNFHNFGNPNMNAMGGIPPFPVNSPFGFPPFQGRGPSGLMGLGMSPVNHFDGPPHPRGGGMHRGQGFQNGREREFNRDMPRDFRRGRERERERDRGTDRDRDRDRDNRDRSGRDREFGENRPRREGRVPCRFFAIGKCKLGDNCTFLHGSVCPTNSARGDSSSRNSQHARSASPPTPLINPEQENWDSAPVDPVVGTTTRRAEDVDYRITDKSHDFVEESPSSPDCLPPGTESPIIIPVIAQNHENDEATCPS